ncbi:MAG: hypothetical protein BYD32DRAFT_439480 [Podila humilis]|nr:MAG: hypothetical protein BYD32DRAFT_439480 [Podila humilis]
MFLPLTFLDIPHVVDAVLKHISIKDLYHCVLVSRAWHKALIPRLWQDVATFRRSGLAPLERRLAKVDLSRVVRLEFSNPQQVEPNKGSRRRWEIEVFHNLIGDNNTLTVIHHATTLQFCMPWLLYPMASVSMLRLFLALQGLSMDVHWKQGGQVLRELSVVCPQLQDISLKLGGVVMPDLARYLSCPDMQLSTVRLEKIERHMYNSVLQPLLLQSTPHVLRSALQLTSTNFPMSSLLEILSPCPNLHILCAHSVRIDGSELEVPAT